MRTGARAIVVGLALALTACGGSAPGASSSNSYQGKTIHLGAILSLTGAGGVYGPSSQKGMQLAVDKINGSGGRSEEHTSELQSQSNIVCRLLLEKKKNTDNPSLESHQITILIP